MAQQSEPKNKAPAVLSAADVAAYLRAHPNFLNEHTDVLEALTPPIRRAGDGVIDMQHFMLDRLRKEVDRLRSYQSELINTTRTNQSIQTRIHAAVVAIIAADSFERLISLVTREMASLLDVDVVTLSVETSAHGATPATPGVMLLAPGSVDAVLGRGQPARLRSGTPGDPAIFGPLAHQIQSAALVRIKPSAGAPDGVLAFGSHDPNGFSEDQSTELLFFLSQVLEHTIRAWLDLPA
jgi:uncharacterized protein YigA (DUF484 family)